MDLVFLVELFLELDFLLEPAVVFELDFFEADVVFLATVFLAFFANFLTVPFGSSLRSAFKSLAVLLACLTAFLVF